MNPNDFKIIFDSERHDVDVETLIACLMRTSNIVQEVNVFLETDKKIEVKIKALEKGSFEIHIELVEKLLESLFSNANLSIASEIVTVVGGLYAFVKFLNGEKPNEIIEKGGKFEVTNANGDVTIIEGNVYNIYNNSPVVRENIAKQFSALEKNDEISGFKFESSKQKTEIKQEEFSAISRKLDTLINENKEPIREIIEAKILIIRPSFDKELKWDFVYNGQKLSAKMEDEAIIEIIDKGEEFSKGDYMLVDLEITQFYDKDLEVYLLNKDSYKIIRYKEHIKSPRTGKLF